MSAIAISRVSHPEFYLRGATIPEPFKAADKRIEELHKDDPIPVKKVKKIPMPFINPSNSNPIIVTEDWYVKKKKKQLTEKSRDLRDVQIEMMQLISKKDRIKFKIAELDPSSKKDAKKIIAFNIELRDIDAELKMLQEQSGIDLNYLEYGSRLARFIGNVKRYVRKRIIKRIKKWFRSNKELIIGIITIVAPVLGGLLFRQTISHDGPR